MMVPAIHDNGTSRERLLAQLTAVTNHLEAAIRALKEACPNARDYHSGADFDRAVSEHVARRRTLSDLAGEIEMLTEAIADAEGPR